MILLFCLWILAILLCIRFVDAPVATWAYWQAIDRDHPGTEVFKMPGEFQFTLAVAIALITWHPKGWRAAGLLALSALLGGALYTCIKWIAGRRRPVTGIEPFRFSPFPGGWGGMFDEPNLSFPSGHACLSFVTATVLSMVIPRWSVLFFALATVVAVERVWENAHYVSDVIFGAGLGVIFTQLTLMVCERFIVPLHDDKPQRQLKESRGMGFSTFSE